MLSRSCIRCAAIDVLVGVCAPTTVYIFVGVELVVIKVRMNVVVESSIVVVTDDFADLLSDVCADILGVSGVEIIVVFTTVIALEFAVPVSSAGNVRTGMVVGVLVDILISMSAGETICVRPGIGVDTLAEVSVNALPDVITLETPKLATFPKLMLCC